MSNPSTDGAHTLVVLKPFDTRQTSPMPHEGLDWSVDVSRSLQSDFLAHFGPVETGTIASAGTDEPVISSPLSSSSVHFFNPEGYASTRSYKQHALATKAGLYDGAGAKHFPSSRSYAQTYESSSNDHNSAVVGDVFNDSSPQDFSSSDFPAQEWLLPPSPESIGPSCMAEGLSNSQGGDDYSAEGPLQRLYFPDDSPEMLILHFDKYTCGILSITNGPSENPWRTLLWPLALESPALYHAVVAMAAFHHAYDVPSMRIVGLQHKATSIAKLQQSSGHDSLETQVAVGVALSMAFSGSWHQPTTIEKAYIKVAGALLKRISTRHSHRPLDGAALARFNFFRSAWLYLDVCARLTSFDDAESIESKAVVSPRSGQEPITGDDVQSTRIDIGLESCSYDARLDPLLGCASRLFLLMSRMADLVLRVCASTRNTPPHNR